MNIEEEIKKAMRNKEVSRLQVLRALKSEITNTSLRKGSIDADVSDLEILVIVRKQVKQRQDSIEQFKKGNRLDLVEKELMEMVILEGFLPKPLTEKEIGIIVEQAILETDATTKKDMGRVMKRATELADGRVDGKALSTLISIKLP